ncbi:flavin reductase family protein [Perspicuibacillus lycopersici]
MGNYPTGVTIVTTVTETGIPLGLTVNSIASVSIDPLLILWSIDKSVSSYPEFMKTGHFAIHILAEDQRDICILFATKGIDRFKHCTWEFSNIPLPILTGTASVLQCRTYRTIEAGDHTIIIGEVLSIQNFDKEPLLYHRRIFGPIPKEFYKGSEDGT